MAQSLPVNAITRQLGREILIASKRRAFSFNRTHVPPHRVIRPHTESFAIPSREPVLFA
jgi:hypothetical protein